MAIHSIAFCVDINRSPQTTAQYKDALRRHYAIRYQPLKQPNQCSSMNTVILLARRSTLYSLSAALEKPALDDLFNYIWVSCDDDAWAFRISVFRTGDNPFYWWIYHSTPSDTLHSFLHFFNAPKWSPGLSCYYPR